MLHILGEQFFLNALFQGGPTNLYIPAFYYLGLDNRPTLFAADTMSGLVGEPSANGYLRTRQFHNRFYRRTCQRCLPSQ